ncbi:MAG: DUF362 domain-containing protein [bacterium]
MSATVALARCTSYDPGRVQQAMERVLDLAGGIAAWARPGDRVLLKPNVLLAAPPERAVCTHPEVLRAAIRALRAFGCRPVVAEQPGIGALQSARRALEVSGILGVCREEGVDCRLFREKGFSPVPLPAGKQVREVMLPRELQEADHVVSLAKVKSHMQAAYTGAIKNFYGAIPFRQRKQIHALAKYVRFSEGIVDVFQAVRPRFGILDGILGMEGRGPSAGKPRLLGLLMASTDLVALDRIALAAVGWDGLRVRHVEDAAARGLGIADVRRIRVAGERLDDVRVPFALPPTAFRNPPRFLLDTLYNLWSIKPLVIREKCTACSTCVAACPAGAIRLDDAPRAVIDYDRCIECFCCHELCPSDAVTEKQSSLKAVLSRLRRAIRPLPSDADRS